MEKDEIEKLFQILEIIIQEEILKKQKRLIN